MRFPRFPLMGEATDATGEGSAGGAGESTATDAVVDAVATDTTTDATVVDTTDADPKPFLGEAPADGSVKPTEQAPTNDWNDEAYLEGVKKDNVLLGDDDTIQLDTELVKAMAPTFKEMGISPEQASKLSNALAKAQIDQSNAMLKDRVEYFKRMKDDAMRKYTNNDWAQINKGIDSCFKVGGIMNNVIRNSELGADPEFLALMHRLGASHATDGVAGAASGAGESVGNPNSFDGMSKLW